MFQVHTGSVDLDDTSKSQTSSEPASSSLGTTRNPSSMGADENETADALEIEVHANEVVSWAQISHLRDWLPATQRIKLVVPVGATTARVVDTIRLCGNLFKQLEHLQVCLSGPHWMVEQSLVGSAVELVQLRSLRLEGGQFCVDELQLHLLAGLKQLESLVLLPVTGEGLSDDHLTDGLAQLTQLTHLEFRGCAEHMSDEGLTSLSGLTRLHQLSITPLGLQVTRVGMAALCSHMEQLEVLTTGFSQSPQVDVLQGVPHRIPHTNVIVADPHTDCASLLTSLSLSLHSTLSTLRVMNSIKVEDTFFMVALGALTALTELSLSVTPARPETPGFLINMAVLSPMKKLQSLELNVVGHRIKMPITPALMSSLATNLTDLTSLTLSCMVPPEKLPTGQFKGPLQPLALTHLSSFTKLKSLTLVEPLEVIDDDGRTECHITSGMIPVALSCLPASLETLELEKAHVLIRPAASPSQGGTGQEAIDTNTQPIVQLPKLKSLALGRCEVSDATLTSLFSSPTQLTRIQFNEVSGITAAALRAMSPLTLKHLEVVDLRGTDRKGKPGETNDTNSSNASGGVTWLGWLLGYSAPSSDEDPTTPRSPTAAVPKLRSADIAALGQVTTLRTLQWGVGRPLGVPSESLVDADGHAVEEADDLSPRAWVALEDLKVARKTLSSLVDLHELYLSTTHEGGTGGGLADEWEEDLVAQWVRGPLPNTDNTNASVSGIAAATARTGSLLGTPAGVAATGLGTRRSEGGTQQGQGRTQAMRSSSGGDAKTVMYKVPKWLEGVLPAGCYYAGGLPVSRHDPWSDQDFYQFI